MKTLSQLAARAGLPTVAAILVALPAAAFQSTDTRTSGTFSAPEIATALVSGAVLVAGGAALILRDRKARRKLDKPE